MNNRAKVAIVSIIILVFIASIIAIRLPAPVGAIIVPDDYDSIQEAVDHALSGQTVYVKSGVYTLQHIIINKPLSIIGENATNTILVGINNIKYSPAYVILVSADDVKISGLTVINGSQGGIRVETIGSERQPNGCTISGNILFNDNTAISNYAGQDLTVSGNQIYGNTEGVYVSASHSKIVGNRIADNRYFGLAVDSCRDVTISDNVITGNGAGASDQDIKGGVCLRWFGDFKVFNNNITGNNGVGVQFGEGAANSIVYDNNILGNKVGVDLFNFALTDNLDSIGAGAGNLVYRNNLVNDQNALVETVFPYGNVSNMAYTVGNGTDMVAWDNGAVGNYWSDYGGTGIYLIAVNNTDNHPVSQMVEIPMKALKLPLLTNPDQPINQVILNVAYLGNGLGSMADPTLPRLGGAETIAAASCLVVQTVSRRG
jgi:nitrous oxidase accessory protein